MFKTLMFNLVAHVFYALGVWQCLLILENKFGWRRCVFCLCYHNIECAPPTHPISKMEQGTNVDVFETQVGTFKDWLSPINDDTLANWLDGTQSLNSDGLLITFDDGYKDNLYVAGPILNRYGLKPVVFIASNYVDSQERFWWIRLSDAMRSIPRSSWQRLRDLELPDDVKSVVAEEDLCSWGSRVRARRLIAQLIEGTETLEHVLRTLESGQVGFRTNVMQLLSWCEIREMSANGFSIGGHTHTHPLLSKLSSDDIQNEISTCQNIIKDKLGRSPCSFAYPAGDYDERVVAHLCSSGFRLAFTTRPGVILPSANPFTLSRLNLSRTSRPTLCFALVVLKLSKYFPRWITSFACRIACSVTPS